MGEPEMVRRYVHLPAEHLTPYVDRRVGFQGVTDEFTAQIRHSARNEKGLTAVNPL
jgi:hypothetical protein